LYTSSVKGKSATMLYRSFRHTRGLWRQLPIAISVTLALVFWQEYNTLTNWLSSQNVHQEPAQANSDDLYYEQFVQWAPDSTVAHREKPHTEHAKSEHRLGMLVGSGHGSKAIENSVSSEYPDAGDSQVPILQRTHLHPSSDVHGQYDSEVPSKSNFIPASDGTRDTNIKSFDTHPQLPIEVLHSMATWSEDYRFPAREECDAVQEKADTLPDMVFIPFEDTVTDIELAGWEDLWISKARYIGPQLAEPRIDFLYNCRRDIHRWLRRD
jgi:hypothetical protein